MRSFHDAWGGESCARARVLSPAGALLRISREPPMRDRRSPSGTTLRIRAACLAIAHDDAAAFLDALETMRRRAVRIGWSRLHQLSGRRKRRIDRLIETPVLTTDGCAACRDRAKGVAALRLCAHAAVGGAADPGAAIDGDWARFDLEVAPEFLGAVGSAGLRMILRRLEPAATPCASC